MVRLVIILIMAWLGIFGVSAKGMLYSDSLVTLKGTVRDADTKKRLANVNVYIPGRDVGTVTNGDGVFALKVDREDAEGKLLFSCLGYANYRMACSYFNGEEAATVYLNPMTKRLGEVTVFGGDAKNLVEEALRKIDVNYSSQNQLLNMFYRETIMKGSRFVGISEGVLDVAKDNYKHRSGVERQGKAAPRQESAQPEVPRHISCKGAGRALAFGVSRYRKERRGVVRQ